MFFRKTFGLLNRVASRYQHICQYIHPRSWRLHRHNLWHVTSTLVFSPDWLDKYALNLELGWENTRSKDVLDESQNWHFIVRYQLNNAKR